MNNFYDYGTYYDSDIYSTVPSYSSTSSDIWVSLIPLIIFGVFLLVFMVYYIFAYVMQAISLQTIARRRGIANPWLAWIPYATNWLFGAIVRDYDKRKGINRRWDKILLTLSISVAVLAIVLYIGVIIIMLVAMFLGAATGMLEAFSAILVLVMYALYIPLIFIVSAFSTLSTICVFKLFESTVPDKALTYFLFYLLVPFAAPICLFACRNKGYELSDESSVDELVSEAIED